MIKAVLKKGWQIHQMKTDIMSKVTNHWWSKRLTSRQTSEHWLECSMSYSSSLSAMVVNWYHMVQQFKWIMQLRQTDDCVQGIWMQLFVWYLLNSPIYIHKYLLSADHSESKSSISQVYTHPINTNNTENASFLNHRTAMPVKPKPRNNIPKKHLKSSRELAVPKKYPSSCSFCGLHSIQMHQVISELCVHFADKDMDKYCSLFNHLYAKIVKIDFEDW